ncbi:MAG: hypothetical protein KDA60_01165 [Planctomycetales bacterium]|nr:hypothetical protein [Planctomycetales bacterium]
MVSVGITTPIQSAFTARTRRDGLMGSVSNPRLARLFLVIVGALAVAPRAWSQEEAPTEPISIAWPVLTQTSRPWTRWWWHGSAVDEAELTRLLETYRDAGIGGVEITCIYGVKGNAERNREYRSDAWVAAIRHVAREAQRLGMGVDLPAGSGWRMGGPTVTMEHANSKVILDKLSVAGGDQYAPKLDRATLQSVVAVNDTTGELLDLSDRIAEGQVHWQVPDGAWTAYALGYRWAGDRVKRPGPGGAGLNINPFSKPAVESFLTDFGRTLQRIPGIRAQFHDSFEYGGDWQPRFLEEFAARRGYRLEQHLPALAGDGSADTVARVKCDYRETLSDMVLENLVQPWVSWAHEHGQLARNQSHGSPANWLDLYAACDIPETESFGRLQGDDADQLVLKFAASAGNVAGRRLVSSETGTWLDEHFNVTLGQLRKIVDRQILAGVNHVFYHGTAYSPAEAAWPGWLFYASTQVNPQNSIWKDLAALNAYVARCQAVLQEAQPDNDVLLYWPLHDAWQNARGLRMEIRVHNGKEWFYGQPLGDAAKLLDEQAYAFDYVSDRGLASCQLGDDGTIAAPGGIYRTVVVPRTKHLPLATLRQLARFAEHGAAIIFWDGMPAGEPGLAGAETRPEWTEVVQRLERRGDRGRVFVGDDLVELLELAGIRREQEVRQRGLRYVRKKWRGGTLYFLKNESETMCDARIVFAADYQSATFMQPMTGEIGLAHIDMQASGDRRVRVQLPQGQAVMLLLTPHAVDVQPWPYRELAGESIPVAGPWQVSFLDGGPDLPAGFTSDGPKPWTDAPDKAAEKFAGTVRYAADLTIPSRGDRRQGTPGHRQLLDLGDVLGSARVRIDGVELATLIDVPYVVELKGMEAGDHRLEVDVTGVAANRIRDLDRRGVEWRIFEDINLVNIDYKKFDASGWPVRPQGLAGPVTLTPLVEMPGNQD